MTTSAKQLEIPRQRLAEVCHRWMICELSLFGSALRSDFRPDSDVDLLVVFSPFAPWSMLDLVDLQEELGRLVGHQVDLVEESSLRNPFRRHAILATREVVYAA